MACAAPVEIVRLEISRRFVESQTVVIVVRNVDEVEEIGHRRGLEKPGILLDRSITEWEIEDLSRDAGPTVSKVCTRDVVRIVITISVQIRIDIVAGGYGFVLRKPAGWVYGRWIGKCH